MKRFTSIALALLAVGHTDNTPAQSCTQSCSQVDTTLYFGNGMLVKYDTALDNQVELAEAFRSFDSELGARVEFRLSYAPTEGAYDAVQAIAQATQRQFPETYDWLLGEGLLPSLLRGPILDGGATILRQASNTNQVVVDTHAVRYIEQLRADRRVIVVSHSQGNFYANRAYEKVELEEPQRVGSMVIVSVANPDQLVGGSNRDFTPTPDYVTIDEDEIIGRVPFALPANATNGDDGTNNHAFVFTYMRPGSPSRGNILGLIADALRSTPSSRDSDGDGFPDSSDQCPEVAGVLPAGCPAVPPPDADGDGVPDVADQCPNEAGPAPSGCPVTPPLDTDGDGVPDIADACPLAPGDLPNGCASVSLVLDSWYDASLSTEFPFIEGLALTPTQRVAQSFTILTDGVLSRIGLQLVRRTEDVIGLLRVDLRRIALGTPDDQAALATAAIDVAELPVRDTDDSSFVSVPITYLDLPSLGFVARRGEQFAIVVSRVGQATPGVINDVLWVGHGRDLPGGGGATFYSIVNGSGWVPYQPFALGFDSLVSPE